MAKPFQPDIGLLGSLLLYSWSGETSNSPETWMEGSPATGQCAITALIVQDYFGGRLMRTEAVVNEQQRIPHYYNQLPDGTIIDLTKEQFPAGTQIPSGEERSRSHVLAYADTVNRYGLLLQGLARQILISQGRTN